MYDGRDLSNTKWSRVWVEYASFRGAGKAISLPGPTVMILTLNLRSKRVRFFRTCVPHSR